MVIVSPPLFLPTNPAVKTIPITATSQIIYIENPDYCFKCPVPGHTIFSISKNFPVLTPSIPFRGIERGRW